MMDWTMMAAIVALWDIARTLAVVLFTAWYTARKVDRNDREKTKQSDKEEEVTFVGKR